MSTTESNTESVTCVECEDSIDAGERRHPTPEGPIHDYCRKRRQAVESYSLYVVNPDHSEGYEYSLWYDHGEFETQILCEGNAGLTVNTKRVDERREAHVEYTITDDGTTAELTGFYPETTQTGRKLYRRTLDALRLLHHAHDEVEQRTSDDVLVESPESAIERELTR